MNFWKSSKDEHIIYEAFSAVADGRVKLVEEKTAHCFSTSLNKFYTVTFEIDSQKDIIKMMSDDNMAFWKHEISYPMLGVLILKKYFNFDESIMELFKNIPWKDINTKNKNDYMKSVSQVLDKLEDDGVDVKNVQNEVNKIWEVVKNLKIEICGNFKKPSKEY